ncbi:hypothetical protein H4F05_11410 [Vibrio cholerae]
MAAQVNVIVSMLTCCLLVTSALPLVVTPIVLLSLFRWANANSDGMLHESLKGAITFDADFCYHYQGRQVGIKAVSTALSAWALCLTRSDGKRVLLWRDSLPDEHYRHLLVALRQTKLQQTKREQRAP